MSFADGTAETRVAARYAEYGSQEELGRAMQAAQRHDTKRAAVYPTIVRVVTPIRPASDRAIDFLVALSAERFPAVTETAVREWAASVDRTLVSEKIDWLKTQPKVVNSGVGAVQYDVPAGYYAVTGNEGHTTFVRVTRPESGQWAGRTFVNVQAGDELHRVSPAVRDALLAKIAEVGAEAASKRYGREIGSCGVCHRTLTDAESREAGIGPVCRAKMGW